MALSGGTVRGPFAGLLMTGDTGKPVRFAGGAPGEDQHTGKYGQPHRAPRACRRL